MQGHKSQTDEAISHAGPQHVTHLTGFPLVFRDVAGDMAEIYKHLKELSEMGQRKHSFRKTRGGNKYETMAAGVQRPGSPRSPQEETQSTIGNSECAAWNFRMLTNKAASDGQS